MKNEVIIVFILITAGISGFGFTTYNFFGEPLVESNIRDWGWSSQYCDKVTYVHFKLNGEYSGSQAFHEYCNI